MGKTAGSRNILTEPCTPTAAVTKGKGTDAAGNQIASAGAQSYGVALEDFTAADAASTAIPKKRMGRATLGTAAHLLGTGGASIGSKLTCAADGSFIVGTTGQAWNATAREAGVAGDEIEALVQLPGALIP